jgi:hypothetical protein
MRRLIPLLLLLFAASPLRADLLPRVPVGPSYQRGTTIPFQMLLFALGLTWLIEWAVAAAILRRCDARLALGVLLVNAVTQPLATAAVIELGYSFWLVEVLVCVVEVPLYRLLLGISFSRAVLISLVANTLSAAASFIL